MTTLCKCAIQNSNMQNSLSANVTKKWRETMKVRATKQANQRRVLMHVGQGGSQAPFSNLFILRQTTHTTRNDSLAIFVLRQIYFTLKRTSATSWFEHWSKPRQTGGCKLLFGLLSMVKIHQMLDNLHPDNTPKKIYLPLMKALYLQLFKYTFHISYLFRNCPNFRFVYRVFTEWTGEINNGIYARCRNVVVYFDWRSWMLIRAGSWRIAQVRAILRLYLREIEKGKFSLLAVTLKLLLL